MHGRSLLNRVIYETNLSTHSDSICMIESEFLRKSFSLPSRLPSPNCGAPPLLRRCKNRLEYRHAMLLVATGYREGPLLRGRTREVFQIGPLRAEGLESRRLRLVGFEQICLIDKTSP